MIKKCFTLAVVFLVALATQAQTGAADKTAPETLQLKETGFDFGKIAQGRPVTHSFTIVNTGATALLLDNVQASCGCTTPEWSREPIKPGAAATIKVGYNAAAEGYFNKTITIQYNTHQSKTLVISGNVYRAPVTSAPVNPSLALLKYQN